MVSRRRHPVVRRRTVHVGDTRIPVETTVTARPGVARRWLHTAIWRERRRLRSRGGLTVGMGVQWPPEFLAPVAPGAEPRPGTLQLCAGGECLVFQLAQTGGAVPRVLRRFLSDPRATFAAYNAGKDLRILRAHHGLEVASAFELRGADPELAGNASLADMAKKRLEIRGVEKSRRVGKSPWGAPRPLSREQVRYAAVDAYLSWRLGVYFREGRHGHDGDEEESSEASESEEADRVVGFIAGVGW